MINIAECQGQLKGFHMAAKYRPKRSGDPFTKTTSI